MLEKILFSSEVYKDKFYFFKKAKIVMVSTSTIYSISKRKKVIKRRNKIEELLGFTRSLYIDSQNFIMHFATRADEELYC